MRPHLCVFLKDQWYNKQHFMALHVTPRFLTGNQEQLSEKTEIFPLVCFCSSETLSTV